MKIDFERIGMGVVLGIILINTLALFWFTVALDGNIESQIAWIGFYTILLVAVYFGREA